MAAHDTLFSAHSTSSGTSSNPNTSQADDADELEAPVVTSTIFATPSHPAPVGTPVEFHSPQGVVEPKMNPAYSKLSGQPQVPILSFNESNSQNDSSPTLPRTFRVSNVDAVVCSQLDSDRKVQFSLEWRQAHDGAAAFFKFRQKVRLLDVSTIPLGRDETVSIFVYIPPDRVRRLTYDPLPNNRPLGPNTISLCFDMTRPPALVFPKAHTPTRAAEDPIANLHELASQLRFTLYVNVPTRTLPEAQIQLLCAGVSAQRVSNLDKFGFQTIPTLYSGQGGQVLEGAEVLAPPAYDDVARLPEAHTASSFHKRRRTDSIGSSISSETMGFAAFEKLLNSRLASERQAFGEMRDALMTTVMARLNEHKSDVSDMLAKHKAEFLDAIESSEVRVSNAVIDGVSDVIDKRILQGTQEVQDSIMEHITSMPLRAEITFPEHPLY